MRISALAFVALLGASPAVAQAPPVLAHSTPTENLTVTAPRAVPDAVLQGFVKSYTAASPASGKIARWLAGVCPITVGLRPAAVKWVTERVRQVAAQVGAPVGATGCKPNIDIVFTLNPQRLLDQVRAKTPILLGYHDPSGAKDLAAVTHPIQAWYTTQTVDLHGLSHIDDKTHYEVGFDIEGGFGAAHFQDAHVEYVTGDHLGGASSSELYHVIIVIDLAKVVGREIGALSDDVAMRALAQTQAFGVCGPFASITNLDAAPCDAAVTPDAITGNDLAYLRGLYAMDASGSFTRQRSQIADAMKASLSGR